jgi:DNA-directed RNA polymerase specialized sigma24 family protein
MDEQALAARARRGDRTAFGDLYEAHAPAAWRLALVVGRDTALAAGAVIDASVRILGHAERGTLQRFEPIRLQLLTAARSAALDTEHLPAIAEQVRDRLPELAVLGSRVVGTDGGVTAFDDVPEQWQSVLWLRHVEQLAPAETAAVLGISEAAAIQLAERARLGLHEQLAKAQVGSASRPGCRRATLRLGAYGAGDLTEREAVRVRRHLDRCEECRQRLDELDDLTPRLQRSIPGLPLTVRDLAEEAWLTDVRGAAGPLGFHLPNGALAPAWAERTLAGATAAVVALGISAAVALGARRGDDPVTRDAAAAQPLGAPDGESALSGELPGEEGTDGGSSIVITPDPGPTGDAPTAPADPPSAPRGGAQSPRSASPRPSGPAAPTTDPTSPPPTSPPTTAPPSDPLTPIVEVVDQVLDPLPLDPPDLCTGVDPLDALSDCD